MSSNFSCISSGCLCLKMIYIKLCTIFDCLCNQLVSIHISNGNADMLTSLCTYHKSLIGKGTIQQILLVECGGGLYTVNFAHQLLYFRLDIGTVY